MLRTSVTAGYESWCLLCAPLICAVTGGIAALEGIQCLKGNLDDYLD